MCYFIVNFSLISMPGDIYFNSYAGSSADAASCIIGGIMYKYLGARKALLISFVFSMCGALMIMLFGYSNPHLMPLFVCMTKMGLYNVHTTAWAVPMVMFPTLF